MPITLDTSRVRVQYAEAAISAPRVRTLRASPYYIVPAPGRNKYIDFIDGSWSLEYYEGDTFASGGALQIKHWNVNYVPSPSGWILSSQIPASEIRTASSEMGLIRPDISQSYLGFFAEDMVNMPLVIHNVGAAEFTGASSNKTRLVVQVVYRVLDFTGSAGQNVSA